MTNHLFTILGVNNKEGIFINRIEKGKKIKQPHYKVQKNDFCYNPARINVGAIGLNRLSEGDNIITGYYKIFRVDEEKIFPEFLFEFFKTDEFLTFVRENVVGAVRMDLKIDDLKKWKISLPPLEYQKNILEKLKKQKEIINTAENIIKNLSAKHFGKAEKR